jgi:hypothetical protein
MRKLTVSILFLITLVGLHIAVPSIVAIGEPDDPDKVIEADDGDSDDGTADVQDQDATALDATASSSTSSETIYLGPSASGEAVRILRTGYNLVPLTGGPLAGPVVVGPADLFTSWIVDQVQSTYEAGHAVALTNATTASIQRLHDLLGHHGSAEPARGGATADLVAFRKAFRTDGELHSSSHVLLPRATSDTSHLSKKAKKQFQRLPKKVKRKLRNLGNRVRQEQRGLADSNDIQALGRFFSPTPEVPEPPPPTGSPQQNLLELAESYESHAIQSDSYGNQVQVVNTVWAARSFMNSADLYYFLQETDYKVASQIWRNPYPFHITSWSNSVNSLFAGRNPTLIQPSPQTTMEATQNISSVSYNIGGSTGWNQTQGLNASISGSVTISNEKVTTIPPINITNDPNFATGQTNWTYAVNELPSQPEGIDLFSQWIWSIPFSSYSGGQTQFLFDSQANLAAQWNSPFPVFIKPINVNLIANLTSTVPLPFGRTFSLQRPVVTSVNPTSVNQGDTFTINGTGFYPSLVNAVLIGGTPLSQDNVTPVSDTQINVVAPAFIACELGCSVVVQTTQGNSNDNVSISIIP